MDNKTVTPKATKYYAVRKGFVPGVYTDVNEYRKQVDGFSGYSARVFKNEKEANDFVLGKITETEIKEERSRKLQAIACPLSKKHQNNWDLRWRAAQTVAAYIDGSHDDKLNKCGYGVVITTGDGREIMLYGMNKEVSKTGLRSVASEICAMKAAIQWAKLKKVKKLIVVYDCNATIDLITKNEPTKNEFLKKFISFYRQVSNEKKFEIIFRKIEGHVGNKYHELADALARYSLGKEIKQSQLAAINKVGVINWELAKPKEKIKKPIAPLKQENYDRLNINSSIYRFDTINNKVVRGNILAIHRDGIKIIELTASFNGEFLKITNKDFGITAFMHRENAQQKQTEFNNN